VRVTTAFNRMLAIPEASVESVRFEREGVVVGLRRRPRRLVCPRCGCLGRAGYDRREQRRWRHLDLGATRCYLECELRRFRCPGCRKVVTETVAWARPGARFSRDFEDVVAWLAQQAAFSVISRLLRVSWRSVAAIVRRVVADELAHRRLAELYLIGVDEISYRRGQRYLTLVADHEDGAVVWAGKGRGAATLERFFDELSEEETEKLGAVSIDMSGGYQKAIRARAAHATVCFDPFHVVALANRALDELRRTLWNLQGKSKGGGGAFIKGTRWALLKDPAALTESQQGALVFLAKLNSPLYRGYPLKEQLRALYAPESRPHAPKLLDAWLHAAARSKLKPFVKLANTLREHREGILNAIRLGLSNSRLEGLASRIQLISHRSFGFHSAEPLIALIHLCCGRISVQLPTRTAEDPERARPVSAAVSARGRCDPEGGQRRDPFTAVLRVAPFVAPYALPASVPTTGSRRFHRLSRLLAPQFGILEARERIRRDRRHGVSGVRPQGPGARRKRGAVDEESGESVPARLNLVAMGVPGLLAAGHRAQPERYAAALAAGVREGDDVRARLALVGQEQRRVRRVLPEARGVPDVGEAAERGRAGAPRGPVCEPRRRGGRGHAQAQRRAGLGDGCVARGGRVEDPRLRRRGSGDGEDEQGEREQQGLHGAR